MPIKARNILALDIGDKRIGVARASTVARLAEPLITLDRDESFLSNLKELIKELGVDTLVVGLPRSLNSQETDQTRAVRDIISCIKADIGSLEVVLQDEALTSVKAEEELRKRKKPFSPGEVDALAATYILEDYLGEPRLS